MVEYPNHNIYFTTANKFAQAVFHPLSSSQVAFIRPTKFFVIESKQSRFDVTSGIPQALSYMLSQPNTESNQDKSRFGMVTNGREVIFLKLSPQQLPVYAQSKVYQVIETQEDLISILQGLKAIGSYL